MPKKLTQSLASELVDAACTDGTLAMCEQAISHGVGPTIATLTAGGVAAGAGGLALPLGFVALRVLKIKDARKREEALQTEFAEIKRLITLAIEGNLEAKTTLSKRLMENEPVDARLPGYEKADLAAYIESRLMPRVNEIAESLGMSIEEGFDGLRIYNQSHDRKLDKVLTKLERHNELLQRVVDDYMARNANLEQDNSALRQQVEHAVQRLADAEARAGRDPAIRLHALRQGNPDDLKAFLINETERAEIDLANKHRELAAVSYITSDFKQSMQSLNRVIELAPSDADAFNLRGCVHSLLGRLDMALSDFKQAESLRPSDLNLKAMIVGNSALAALRKGNLKEAIEGLNSAVELNRSLNRLSSAAMNYLNLGLAYRQQGDMLTARLMTQKALDIDADSGNLLGVANAYGNLGTIELSKGNLDDAKSLFEKSLGIHTQYNWKPGIADQLGNISEVLRMQGYLDEAGEALEKSIKTSRAIGDKLAEATTSNNLGIIRRMRGDYEGAKHAYNLALTLHRELGSQIGIANALGNLGNIAISQSRYDEAEEFHQEALRMHERMDQGKGIADALGNLGMIALHKANHTLAEQYFTRSLSVNEKISNTIGIANCLGNLSLIYKARGDRLKAVEYIQRSLKLNRRAGQLESIAGNLVNLGNLCVDFENYSDSITHYHEAISLYSAMGNHSNTGSALFNLSIAQASNGEIENALESLRMSITELDAAGDQRLAGTARQTLDEFMRVIESEKRAP